MIGVQELKNWKRKVFLLPMLKQLLIWNLTIFEWERVGIGRQHGLKIR